MERERERTLINGMGWKEENEKKKREDRERE